MATGAWDNQNRNTGKTESSRRGARGAALLAAFAFVCLLGNPAPAASPLRIEPPYAADAVGKAVPDGLVEFNKSYFFWTRIINEQRSTIYGRVVFEILDPDGEVVYQYKFDRYIFGTESPNPKDKTTGCLIRDLTLLKTDESLPPAKGFKKFQDKAGVYSARVRVLHTDGKTVLLQAKTDNFMQIGRVKEKWETIGPDWKDRKPSVAIAVPSEMDPQEITVKAEWDLPEFFEETVGAFKDLPEEVGEAHVEVKWEIGRGEKREKKTTGEKPLKLRLDKARKKLVAEAVITDQIVGRTEIEEAGEEVEFNCEAVRLVLVADHKLYPWLEKFLKKDHLKGNLKTKVKAKGISELPDLEVSNARTERTPTAGEPNGIGADLTNVGKANSGPFTQNWYLDGTLIHTTDGTDIPPGTPRTPGFPYTFSEAGTFELKYEVVGVAGEKNLANNSQTITVTVAPPPTRFGDWTVPTQGTFYKKVGGAFAFPITVEGEVWLPQDMKIGNNYQNDHAYIVISDDASEDFSGGARNFIAAHLPGPNQYGNPKAEIHPSDVTLQIGGAKKTAQGGGYGFYHWYPFSVTIKEDGNYSINFPADISIQIPAEKLAEANALGWFVHIGGSSAKISASGGDRPQFRNVRVAGGKPTTKEMVKISTTRVWTEPAQPVAGQPAKLFAEMENTGNADGDTMALWLVNGQTVTGEKVTVPAGQKVTASVDYIFPSEGDVSVIEGGTAIRVTVNVEPPPPPPGQTVPANAEMTDPGTDMGIDLAVGDRVTITASGNWTGNIHDNPPVNVGPDGNGIVSGQDVCGSGSRGQLIGRVGGSNYFPVGSNFTFTIEPGTYSDGGRLRLGFNDVSGKYSDNSGYITVKIDVTKAPPSSGWKTSGKHHESLQIGGPYALPITIEAEMIIKGAVDDGYVFLSKTAGITGGVDQSSEKIGFYLLPQGADGGMQSRLAYPDGYSKFIAGPSGQTPRNSWFPVKLTVGKDGKVVGEAAGQTFTGQIDPAKLTGDWYAHVGGYHDPRYGGPGVEARNWKVTGAELPKVNAMIVDASYSYDRKPFRAYSLNGPDAQAKYGHTFRDEMVVSTAKVGQTVYLRAGKGFSISNFQDYPCVDRLLVNGVEVQRFSTNPEANTGDIPYTFSQPGKFVFRYEIDAENAIPETNEDDNVAEWTVTVETPVAGPPKLTSASPARMTLVTQGAAELALTDVAVSLKGENLRNGVKARLEVDGWSAPVEMTLGQDFEGAGSSSAKGYPFDYSIRGAAEVVSQTEARINFKDWGFEWKDPIFAVPVKLKGTWSLYDEKGQKVGEQPVEVEYLPFGDDVMAGEWE